MISEEDREFARREARRKMRLDIATAMAQSLDEERAEEKIEHIHFLERLLRHDATPVEQLQGLPFQI